MWSPQRWLIYVSRLQQRLIPRWQKNSMITPAPLKLSGGRMERCGCWRIALLVGGLAGAAGAAGGTLTAPNVASALDKAGVDPDLAKALTGLSSALVGAAVGGTAGGAAAYNEVVNNYLKHEEDEQRLKKKAACATSADPSSCRREVEKAYKQIGRARQQRTCSDADSCRENRREIEDDLQNTTARQSLLEQRLYQGKLTDDEKAEYFSNGQQIQLMQAALQEANRQFRAMVPLSQWTLRERDTALVDALTALGGMGQAAVLGSGKSVQSAKAGTASEDPTRASVKQAEAHADVQAPSGGSVKGEGIATAKPEVSGASGKSASASAETRQVDSTADKAAGFKNPSGTATSSANAARDQYYGNGSSESPSPGTNAAGSSGKNVELSGGSRTAVDVGENSVPVKTNQGSNIEVKAADGVVASRINVRKGDPNITGSGLEYAWKKHGGGWGENKSAFTITKEELKSTLQDPLVVNTPAYKSATTDNYIRTVDMGRPVGIDAKAGQQPTNFMTVITDSKGNLVNVFPGKTF